MITLSREEFDRMYGEGAAESIGSPTATSPSSGFMSNVANDFSTRASNVKQNFQDAATLRKDPIQNIRTLTLRQAGQAAGFVNDVIGEGISAVTPNAIKEPLSAATQKVMQTKPAQDIMAQFQSWSQTHPEAAKDLESAINISALLPVAKGISSTASGIKRTIGVAQNTTSGIAQGIEGAGKSAIKNVTASVQPENIMQRVARIPKSAQAKFEKTAGESVGSYLVKRGIYGNTEEISTQLYKRFETSRNAADDALASLKGTYKPPALKTALQELIEREKRVSSPGAVSPDFKRTRELVNKFKGEGLTMSEVNEVKRLFERNVRLDFVKQNLPEGVARSTNIDNALRTWQFEQAKKLGLKNLPSINKETRLAKQLLDDLGREMAGTAGNNIASLTDIILLASGDPAVISGFLLKKGAGSKAVQSYVAKKLYKGEKIGQPTAEFGTPKPGIEEFLNKN